MTVVVPVWGDYRKHLPELLESLRPIVDPERTLVVDNASEQPIELSGYPVVRLECRLSAGAARNAALPFVRTRFVSFWDADDRLWDPGAWSRMVELLGGDERLAAVTGGRIDSRTGERYEWPPEFAIRASSRPRLFFWLNAIRACFSPISAVLRTEDVIDCGGFADVSAAEDWALGSKLASRGRIAMVADPVRWYRVAPGSLWGSQTRLADFRRHRSLVRRALRSDPGLSRWRRTIATGLAVPQLVELYARLVVVEPRLGRSGAR